ncbi:ZIP family metal transporter [Sporosarcina sp. G11-34]|uniref:ZIP family metal transporter n=1 Tax=Sporosarcina sp. G11-34 TaxID=2849605 RepID=UPI0022A97D9B|nr:ZIP family metal transporter [Sporosarcina sp. G11-34]MCZ2260728.1 ZIP family metal transporter [Sporosarcina sp. G11-34]
MNDIWFVGFIATFFGVGIGGVLSFFINGFKRSVGTIYAVCTGLILGLISFEIAPEAIRLGNWIVLALGFIAGVVLFKAIHAILEVQLHKRPDLKSGFLLALIISIHNFPIGVILGTSEESDISTSLLQTLILHNIPEGMILFTLLFIAGFRFLPLLLLSFVLAVPVAAGALLGEVIGTQHHLLWAFLLSLTVGTIYMVTMKEILPEARKHSSKRYSLFVTVIAFCLIGAYVIYL